MANRKSIKKNAVLNAVRTFASIVFPLITFPYAARVLGADNIGKVQFGLSIITYFSLISALGVSSYGTREGAGARNDREKFSKLASEIFTINIISSIASYVLLFILLLIPSELSEYRTLIFIQSIVIIFNTVGVEWVFSAKEDYLAITLRSIATQLISLVLLFIFVRSEGDYYIYAGITVFASASVSLFNFFYARKYCDIRLTRKMNFKKHIPALLVLFASGLAVQIYATSDITMLGIMQGDYNVGVYSVAVKIFSIAKALLAAIVTVSIPRFAYYYARKEEENFKNLGGKILNYCLLLIFPVLIGLFLLSENAIMLVGGAGFLDGVNALRILSLALLFSVLSTLFGGGILIGRRQEKKFLFATVLAAVLNIGLNFICIPILAQNGAAITTVIAEFTVMTINGIFAVKFCNLKDTPRTIIHVTCGCIAIGASYCFIHLLGLDYILEAILVTLVGGGGYVTVMLLLKNKYAIDLARGIISKIRKK